MQILFGLLMEVKLPCQSFKVFDINVINVDGAVLILTANNKDNEDPTWSPDGN